TAALDKKIASIGFELMHLPVTSGSREDAGATIRAALSKGIRMIVADGYHFGSDFQEQISRATLRLLLCDDYGHSQCYHADFILNQNLGATAELYGKRAAQTRLLLGPSYVLLRTEFLSRRNFRREVPEKGTKVLVTLGGADPDNVTKKVLD